MSHERVLNSSAHSDPRLLVFLLIGQSNMEGVPRPEAVDLAQDPRVRVLAYDNSGERTYNEWYTAHPPLHSSDSGVGPGDYFAKTLVAALPARYSIGLVPCAINGVDIDFFRKGITSARRGEFRIPPDNQRHGAYEWVIHRAQLAQRVGVIRGILFHQGESDCEDPIWVDKVTEMVHDLRTDLNLGPDVPFFAGELYHAGCCSAHNGLVNQLPHRIPNCRVISADGIAGIDRYHLDLRGQRELGRRYARALLDTFANRADRFDGQNAVQVFASPFPD